MQIITSNYYSVLYYNSEIWHINSLKTNLKQILLSSSAKAIKTCVKYSTNDVSFIHMHKIHHRATPDQFLMYKHSISLYKLLNGNDYSLEWSAINFNQILTSRQIKFISCKINLKKVGLNPFCK